MKKYCFPLVCFAFLLVANVFAQPYTVVKLTASEEMIQDKCVIKLFDNNETTIWACTYGAFRQYRSGEIEQIIIKDTQLNPIDTIWLTDHSYVYLKENNDENSSIIMRCDEECHDITPPDTTCATSGGLLQGNSRGDVYQSCFSTNVSNGQFQMGIHVVPSRINENPITSAITPFKLKSSFAYSASFINNVGQFAFVVYAGNFYGKFWNGSTFRSLAKGSKENLRPLALLDDGRVIGIMPDIAWKPHIRIMDGGKVKEALFTTKAGQRLMKKGTYFEPIAKSTDGSLLVRIYPKGMRKQFAIIKGTKIELTKIDPTINTMWKAGAVNDCGSAIGIQKPSTVFPNAETGLFLIRKAGC